MSLDKIVTTKGATERNIVKSIMNEIKEKYPSADPEELQAAAEAAAEKILRKKPQHTYNDRQAAGAHPGINTEIIDKITNTIFGTKKIKNGQAVVIHSSKKEGNVSLVVNEMHELREIFTGSEDGGEMVEATTEPLEERQRNYYTALLNLLANGQYEITFLQLLRELNPALAGNARKKHIGNKEFKEIMNSILALQTPITAKRTKGGYTKFYQGALLLCTVEGTYQDEDGSDSISNMSNAIIRIPKDFKSPLLDYAQKVKELFSYPKVLLMNAGNAGIIHTGRYLLRRIKQMDNERRKAIRNHKAENYNRRVLWETLYAIEKPYYPKEYRGKVQALLESWAKSGLPLWENGPTLHSYKLIMKGRKYYAIDLNISQK